MSESKMREALEHVRRAAHINDYGDWALDCGFDMNIVDEALAQPAARVKIPDQLYDSYAVFKRAEASCPSLQGHQVRHVLDAVVALIRKANQEKGHVE